MRRAEVCAHAMQVAVAAPADGIPCPPPTLVYSLRYRRPSWISSSFQAGSCCGRRGGGAASGAAGCKLAPQTAPHGACCPKLPSKRAHIQMPHKEAPHHDDVDPLGEEPLVHGRLRAAAEHAVGLHARALDARRHRHLRTQVKDSANAPRASVPGAALQRVCEPQQAHRSFPRPPSQPHPHPP